MSEGGIHKDLREMILKQLIELHKRVKKLEEGTPCCAPNTMANLADAEEIAEWVRIQKAGQKLADKMFDRLFEGRRGGK